MTGKMNSKPRYVRCPRCRNILPEPPDVLVYKCGGCGAILQAKRRNKTTVYPTSHRLDDGSSGKGKVDQVFDDQEAGSSSNQQSLPSVAGESDQNSDHGYLLRSDKDQDAANEAENAYVHAPSHEVKEYSYGKQKMKQLSHDHEASSSSNQQSLVNPMDGPHRIIHNDPRSSTELSGHENPESSPEATGHNRIDQEQNENRDQDHYQDSGKKQENTDVAATSVGLEHSSGKQKINHLSDDYETCSSLNQQFIVNSINDLDQNNDHKVHNSSEQTYHEEPESSSGVTVRNRIDQDYHDDYDQVFLSCRHESEFEESSSEFEDTFANSRIVRDSDDGSKSSFKSLIAEKLLDTRQKKAAYQDEDDILSEDVAADLHRRRKNDHISSLETVETARFAGKSCYEYEGSVSSFDGNDNQIPIKHRISRIGDEHVDSRDRYRFNRRNRIHPFTGGLGKDEHRSTDFPSYSGLNEFHENHKHRSHIIRQNPKMERIELLKMMRALQEQLERTNISNPQQVPLYNSSILNSPGRYGQRMAFSGEAMAVNRRRDGSSCDHCCPQDRYFSAQLPRQHACCHGPHYEPNNSYYSPRFSALSSPIHNHSEPEYSAPNDYRNRNDVTKLFHSPKKKRYVRPIAGGSPWITCYRCSNLLELPQSFLVLNKRYHSLRCGACLKVLIFTLSNGTHVSRYYSEETTAAPPTSEVEDYYELSRSRAGPVSCSDRSFQKSYSAETDVNGSREFSEERRKATMSRDGSGSSQPSCSKISGRRNTPLENRVEHRPNGSPLHRLMGYATPSKVIRG